MGYIHLGITFKRDCQKFCRGHCGNIRLCNSLASQIFWDAPCSNLSRIRLEQLAPPQRDQYSWLSLGGILLQYISFCFVLRKHCKSLKVERKRIFKKTDLSNMKNQKRRPYCMTTSTRMEKGLPRYIIITIIFWLEASLMISTGSSEALVSIRSVRADWSEFMSRSLCK